MGEGLNYKEIGKNIRYYRIKAGLKQNQLSDIIDVSPQHISHIESGVQLSLPVLVKIANVLDVGVDCLLGSNLHMTPASGSVESLIERTRNFSRDDYDKLLKVCDIFFP